MKLENQINFNFQFDNTIHNEAWRSKIHAPPPPEEHFIDPLLGY